MRCERPLRATIKKVISVETEQPAAAIAEGAVCSADGTRIGFRRLGLGPAIVMVHGSVSTHTDWMAAARLLSSRHTCYVMDRRGRRSSGPDHAPYAIEREFEDVCAVLKAVEQDAAGPGAVLAGHSYGAICAMGAALRRPVPKLILYEPPLSVGGPVAGAPLADYARAVAAGNNERAMELAAERQHHPIKLDRVLAIGDSVRTDLAGAHGFGIDCLFVTRGIHAEEFEGIDQLDPASVKELFGHPPRALTRELRW